VTAAVAVIVVPGPEAVNDQREVLLSFGTSRTAL